MKSDDDRVLVPPQWTWRTFPRRYLLAIMTFFGFFHLYVLRVNMSIAIVAMNSNQTRIDANGSIYLETEFHWTSKERGLVLSSLFYGYITTQMVGGLLAPVLGGGRLYGLAILFSGVLSLLIPIAARQSIWAVVSVRALQGALQGLVFPSQQNLFASWSPPMERTKLVTIAYSGNHFGTFVAMITCGALAQSFGWASTFYVYGSTAIAWSALWFCGFSSSQSAIWSFGFSENPMEDGRITEAERDYIMDSIGPLRREKLSRTPWRSILTSAPFWANVVATTVFTTGLYTFITQLPTFVDDLTGWRVDRTGWVSAIPYLSLAVTVQLSGQLADFLRTRMRIRTTVVRRSFCCGCHVVQLTFLLIAAHSYSSIVAVMSCLTVAVAAGGFSAHSVNFQDLAPQHVSVLIAVSNTFATLPGIVVPIVTGWIVQNKEASEWQTVFYITASVYAVGALTYGLFASGERQPWAVASSDDRPVDEENETGALHRLTKK